MWRVDGFGDWHVTLTLHEASVSEWCRLGDSFRSKTSDWEGPSRGMFSKRGRSTLPPDSTMKELGEATLVSMDCGLKWGTELYWTGSKTSLAKILVPEIKIYSLMWQSKNVSLEELQKDGIIFSKNYIKYARKTFEFLRQRKTLETTEAWHWVNRYIISKIWLGEEVRGVQERGPGRHRHHQEVGLG